MNRRGIVDVALLVIVGAAGIVAGSWKPLNMFAKKPPTAALSELQVKLDVATADAAKARAESAAAVASERLRLEQQVRGSQRDNLGAATAIKRVPKEHRTAEVLLAASMIDRTGFKLGAAIGRLPEEDAAQMVGLIDELLSNKQAEIDEANRKLAALDADFKAVTAEREVLKAQLPKLAERAIEAEKTVVAVQVEVKTKTQQVKDWADKTFAAEQQNGSLWSGIKKAALFIGGIYLFLAFGLPAIVKHLESTNPLKSVLRNVSGYALNPLVFHDGSKKIADLQQKLSTAPFKP